MSATIEPARNFPTLACSSAATPSKPTSSTYPPRPNPLEQSPRRKLSPRVFSAPRVYPDAVGPSLRFKKSRRYFATSVKKLFKVCVDPPFKEVVNDKL